MTAEEGSGNAERKSRRSQIIASVIVNLPLISCGLAFSWVTVAKLNLETNEGSWVVAATPIGACFGPILSALLLDRIGRKWFLYGTTFPFIASWILTYLAKSWTLYIVARLISGVSIGAIYTMVPVYLGELMEPRIRGSAGTMMSLFLNLGYIVMYGVGPRLDRKMMALVCLVPCVVFLLTAPWIPESPYYYLKREREKYAALSLVWLRRTKDNTAEINEIKEFIKAEEKGSVMDLYRHSTYKIAMLLVLLLLAGQQLSGFIAIQSYAVTLLIDMHLSLNTNLVLIIMGSISLVMSVLSTFIIDRLGRRLVFLTSSYSTSLCLLVVGLYFLLNKIGMKIESLSIIPLIAVFLYLIFFSFGLATIPSVFISEIFPISVKSWATTIANTYGSLLGLVVTQCYSIIQRQFGYHVLFLFFAIVELVVAIVASIYMPETARKSFMEIQNILKEKDSKKIAVSPVKAEDLNETK
ncbi:PREDICTED: facilitated trehalose transporter Tret1-like [Habropoda laboriosa]|uniref:facilitated trehalose transporter Tret1-like n=1 Tax=Habropoda laboriosa TaxID=597456 RepID=UPI00083DE556|nr:PREDICTED: facilitated trehalose transporter Tret1-like [Habropoda laboriosa]